MRRQIIAALNAALDRILINQPLGDLWAGSDEEPLSDEENGVTEVFQKLQKLQDMHNELQHFSVGLSKGELGVSPPPRTNYLASGLKQLQMHLRHLTWQTQRISEGDYNQKVDFMGEFSEAFNKMVDKTQERELSMLAQRETMLRVFDQIEPIFIVAEYCPTEVFYANKMARLRFHLDTEGLVRDELLFTFRNKCRPEESEQFQDKDSGRWYRVSCERFFWEKEKDSRLFHCVDITAHVKRENDLEQEAHTDKLTGLNNRYVFERSFDKLWDMCRQNQSPLSIIMFDIDLFKKCNDTYGHIQGDKCLTAFAGILRASVGRFNDIVARFGGEEFVALLPFTSEEAAAKIADTVRMETENMDIPVVTKDHPEKSIRITVSGGVAGKIPTFEALPEELLEAADKALYQAKQTGRNKICIAGQYEESDQTIAG